MPEAIITNPAGAYRQVADFTTWVDGNGGELTYDQEIATYRSNSALINRGDAVQFAVPTATTPLSVTPFLTTPTNAVFYAFAGVALDPCAVTGQSIRVCIRGYCRIQVGTATPAAFDVAVGAGSAGAAVAVLGSASVVAATVMGTAFGIFLGPKEAGTNLAPIRLGRF